MGNEKKLYRKEEGKMIAGVCAGLGEYFSIDVSIIRLAWVVFSLLGGCGILAYIIALIVIPQKPNEIEVTKNDDDNKE